MRSRVTLGKGSSLLLSQSDRLDFKSGPANFFDKRQSALVPLLLPIIARLSLSLRLTMIMIWLESIAGPFKADGHQIPSDTSWVSGLGRAPHSREKQKEVMRRTGD